MANDINFFLKDSKPETQVQAIFRFNGKRIKFSINQLVKSKQWNTETHRLKTNYKGASEVNEYIDSVGDRIRGILREAKILNTDVTHDYIKSKFNYIKQENKIVFVEQFNEFIKDNAAVKDVKTVSSYKRTLLVLIEFTQKEKIPLGFEAFDKQFETKFKGYLFGAKKLLNSSADKYIKDLKTFLNYASDLGINTKHDYLKYKRLRDVSKIVSLRAEELTAIEDLNLIGRPGLEAVRDYFCFCCHSGFRYGDVSELKFENINGRFLEIIGEKGKREVNAPLMPQAEKFIDYSKGKKGLIFKSVTNQTCNKYMKEIAELAGLGRIIEQVWYRGKERLTSTNELYKIITFHMSKKTFITLKRNDGVPMKFIMAATGNRSLQNMSRYDEYDKNDTYKAFAERYDTDR